MSDDRQGQGHVRATPDDGRVVWEAIERSGKAPNDGEVARALTASGRFAPVDRTTVRRWRLNGWQYKLRVGTEADSISRAVTVLQAVDPAAAGSAKKTIAEGVDLLRQVIDRFPGSSDSKVMRGAARQLYANAMVLSQKLQEHADALMADDPSSVGRLAKAIADSVRSANQAMAIHVEIAARLLRTLDDDPVDNDSGDETEEDFDDIFDGI